jgi:hypothetical protein
MTDIPEEATKAVVDAIAGGTISVPDGYGNLATDDAENIAHAALTAAAPIIRAEERKKIAEEIRATNLGAPLVLNSDGTARFLSGPELREKICTFIIEGIES